MNDKLKQLLSLKRAEPPEYASRKTIVRIQRALDLETLWVDRFPHHLLRVPGSVGYSCGYIIAEDEGVVSYVHDLAHAAVASIRRPKTWRLHDNYGCTSDEEEIDACKLQFFWMEQFNIWDKNERDVQWILGDYSFDCDIEDNQESTYNELWSHLCLEGLTLARRLRVLR